jgi:putative sigma-54 modulation protein
LNDDEAVMKMELSGDPVMVFRAEDNRQLKVIYRRQDGNYGIIAPEA